MLKNLDNYNQSEPIGNGGYGKVYIAEENQTGNQFAVKFLHLLQQYHSNEAFQEEVARLSSVHHLCLKEIVGCVTENQSEIQPEQLPGIITTYEQSSLDKEIKEEFPTWLNLANQVAFLFGIASALNKLHENKIYHGDLKPSNIYLKKESKHGFVLPLIGDYGLASISEPEESVSQSAFRAPELINGFLPSKNPEDGNSENETYSAEVIEPNEKTDVFSFGMLVFYIFVNKYPRGKSAKPLLQGKRPEIPKTIPHGIRKVLSQCWEHDPSQRPSMKTVMKMLIESRVDLEHPAVGEFMYEIEPQLYSLTQIALLHHDNLKSRVLMSEKEKALADEIESLKTENQELKTQLAKLRDFGENSKNLIEEVKNQVENNNNAELYQEIENAKAEAVNEAVNQSYEKFTESFRDKKLRKSLLYPQKLNKQTSRKVKRKVHKKVPIKGRGFNGNEEESFEGFDELTKDEEEEIYEYEYDYEYDEEEDEDDDDLISPQNKRLLKQISHDIESVKQKQDEADRTFQEMGNNMNTNNDTKISNLNRTVDTLSEKVEKANGMVNEIRTTFIPSINSLQTDYGKIKSEINDKFSQLERTLSDISNSYQEVNSQVNKLHENVETFTSNERSKREVKLKNSGKYLGDLANYEFLGDMDQNVAKIIEDFNQRLNKIEMMMNLQNEEVSSCLERLNLLSGANLSNIQKKLTEIENLIGKVTIHKDELEANLIRYAIPLPSENKVNNNLNHSQPVTSNFASQNFSPTSSKRYNFSQSDEEEEKDKKINNDLKSDSINLGSLEDHNDSENPNNNNEENSFGADENAGGENNENDNGIESDNANENETQQIPAPDLEIEEEEEESNQPQHHEDGEFTLKPFEEFENNNP